MTSDLIAVIYQVMVLVPAFVLVLTFRGFFRALVANFMGDRTARNEGFMTLNPAMHVDLLGLLILLFILGIIGGFLGVNVFQSILFLVLVFAGIHWSYRVPIDSTNFKKFKRGTILVSIAGSLGNFLLVLLTLYFMRYFPFKFFPAYVGKTFIGVCDRIAGLAVFFGLIHLIPIPPFDGGQLLQFILPSSKRNIVVWFEENAFFVFLIFIFLSDLFFIFLSKIAISVYLILSCLVF